MHLMILHRRMGINIYHYYNFVVIINTNEDFLKNFKINYLCTFNSFYLFTICEDWIMDNRSSSDDSDIWLKYCEECVKSKLEIKVKSPTDPENAVLEKDPP